LDKARALEKILSERKKKPSQVANYRANQAQVSESYKREGKQGFRGMYTRTTTGRLERKKRGNNAHQPEKIGKETIGAVSRSENGKSPEGGSQHSATSQTKNITQNFTSQSKEKSEQEIKSSEMKQKRIPPLPSGKGGAGTKIPLTSQRDLSKDKRENGNWREW